MTHVEIRRKFFEYFKKNGHVVVSSSSLIPSDPSVLLTTAGMQQFKPYYTGEADAMRDFGSLSIASIQKCFRTSDIDEVGDDTHFTFFEMAGNFSFGYKPGEPVSPKGGYFKREAIKLAHGFLTKELGLKISYVTVFEGAGAVPKDTESRTIWNELGVENVREEGMESVFWGPTGSSGPCGPTTEIYCNAAGQDVEIWNVVFNEYFCTGSREELSQGKAELKLLEPKGIDTGMGLERLTMIVQKAKNVWETDLFAQLFQLLENSNLDLKKKRIIIDHLRASVFLISDGVTPSNKGAGYILRRLLRRVLGMKKMILISGLHRSNNGVNERLLQQHILIQIVDKIIEMYSGAYPELLERQTLVGQVITEENEKFSRTIDVGIRELRKITELTPEKAFMLYESYGLPFELINDLVLEMGGGKVKGVPYSEFQKEFERHQQISRAGVEKKFGGHGLLLDTGELKAATPEEAARATKLHTATHLLQAALRKVLGSTVHQLGSDITPERLRFDFNFDRKLTEKELRLTEEFVNGVIIRNLSVKMKEEDFDVAVREGALAFFKGKYPSRVKVYSVEDVSKEVCGGPHVARTGEIGNFKIVKDEAVAAGVRRIRATIR